MAAEVSLRELLSDAGRRNPYPFYARLHELGEAVPLSRTERFAVAVCGYRAAGEVLRDANFRVLDADFLDRGRTSWRDHPVLRTLQSSLFNAGGPEHARVRKLFSQAVTARRVAALEPAITDLTEQRLARLAELGAAGEPVDFMAAFALPLPSDVVGELLGVPPADRGWLLPRVRAFDAVLEIGQRTLAEVTAADAAALELAEYFGRLVAARRAEPTDDLISHLVLVHDEQPDQLSEAELLANLIVVFNAGFRTTANLFGNGLPVLLDHPDAVAALRADESLAPGYVEEILRYEPPVHFAVRFADSDAEIAGVPIRAGQLVVVLTGAANRDPRRFADPDRFDPTRPDNQHLAFSAGPHYCLGAALGRVEGRIALPRLLARFPDLALAAEPGARRALMLRGYDQLPVRLTAAASPLAGSRLG
ncbi:MAG: cytochrome P450 [Jatrophihabitantaceae bacterium]